MKKEFKLVLAEYINANKDNMIGSDYDDEDYAQFDLSKLGDPDEWVADENDDLDYPDDKYCWSIDDSAYTAIDPVTNEVVSINKQYVEKRYYCVFTGGDFEYGEIRFGVYIMTDGKILIGEY